MMKIKIKTEPRVLVVGYAHFRQGFHAIFNGNPNAEYMEKENGWDKMTTGQRARYAKRFDVVHYFWAKVTLSEILRVKLRNFRIRIVFHFIGSDVLLVAAKRRKRLEYAFYQCLGIRMFADFQKCADELIELGLRAQWLPFVNLVLEDFEKPLPETFSAIAYAPADKETFYRLDWILEAAGRLPDIPFTVFPNDAQTGLPNVRCVRRFENVLDAMNDHSVFLRLPRHDGLPSTVLEALSCARHVVWTFDHPFCRRAGDAEELIRALSELKAENRPNREGKSYAIETYRIDSLRSRYRQIWGAS
jgi:hypothetical protein